MLKINELKCSKVYLYEKKDNTIEQLIGMESNHKNYIHKFIDYNSFEKKLTKLPSGFKKIILNKNEINDYYCSSKKLHLSKSNPIYLNIKNKLKNYKYYFIHDNRSRPFIVYYNKNNLNVYIYGDSSIIQSNKYFKLNNDYNMPYLYLDLIKFYKPVKIFIGKSILNDMTQLLNTFGKEFDGNTILLHLSKNTYVYIGDGIYEFNIPLNDEIINYYSIIGNNDVPYPVAIGKKYLYFLLEGDKTYIDFKFFINLNEKQLSNAYSYYYGHNGDKPLEKYSKKIKNLKFIYGQLF